MADLAGWIQNPLDERTIVNTLEHAFSRRFRKLFCWSRTMSDLVRLIAAGFDRQGVRTVDPMRLAGDIAAIAGWS
jgi:hypothetical protein